MNLSEILVSLKRDWKGKKGYGTPPDSCPAPQWHPRLLGNCLHKRTSQGSEGGCSPPSYRNFWNFSGKTLMIRAKVLGRKLSERLSKPDYFLHVCLVKMELRPNDRTIQVICFGKAMYRLHVFRGNPRDGYYFHEQKNDIIKTRKDLDVFVVALKRQVFSGFTKSCFKIILNFT